MDKIQLQKGQFSPCSVGIDPKTGKFEKNTVDEIYVCCSRKCDKYREKCKEFCYQEMPKRKSLPEASLLDCQVSCGVMGDVCDKICESARFNWDQKIFDPCLINSGCLRGEILDNDCLVNKKDELLNCCLQNCQPSIDLNCQQHCNISYDINLQRSLQDKIPTPDPVNFSLKAAPIKPKNNLGLSLIILASCLILIFSIVLWFPRK